MIGIDTARAMLAQADAAAEAAGVNLAAGLDGRPQDEPFSHTPWYDVADNRIDIVLESGDKISLWWATKNEWLGLIDVAGLELEALYGSIDDRAPLNSESRKYVFVTRRP